jgi:hypothetical protein
VLERAHITRNELSWAIVHREIAAIELHQPARGRAALEELAGKLDQLRPDLRIAAEWTLSRALCASGGDRTRAGELARHAQAESDRIGARRDEVMRIRRWASHHSCDRAVPHRP